MNSEGVNKLLKNNVNLNKWKMNNYEHKYIELNLR